MTRDLNKLQAIADQQTISELLKKWTESSKSPEIKKASDAFLRLFFYINQLETERYSFDNIIDEKVSERTKALHRATEAEKLALDLANELESAKKSLKAFTG